MNLITKVIVWIVLSLFAAVGAKAGDVASQNVQAARMVICSSAEKAQHFAAQHQDVQAAIAKDETKDASGAASACLVAGIAYISGKQMDRVSSKDGVLPRHRDHDRRRRDTLWHARDRAVGGLHAAQGQRGARLSADAPVREARHETFRTTHRIPPRA